MKPNRYVATGGPQVETQPGSHGRVLRNLPGIHTKRGIDRAEFDALLAVQTQYVQEITTATRFSSALLRQMHRDWLGEIYTWAGEYRTVIVSKANFMWPPPHLIDGLMDNLERDFLRPLTPCKPGNRRRVALDIATIHGELLLVHPFREGNGRIARWLADLMALQSGWPPPAYRFTGRGSTRRREQYLTGVKRAYLRDFEPLAAFFEAALSEATSEGAP